MLAKQPFEIGFGQGLDTKTDPKQLKAGKFLSLINSVFQVGGRLTKRFGFKELPSLPDNTYTYSTTFNGNLTAVGPSIAAYNADNKSWVSKGQIFPLSLSTLPLIRNSVNQSQCDAVVAGNGLVCTVYTETNGASTAYKYAIADSVTGQNIVTPTTIPVSSGVVTGSPRVFLLGNYFVIVFTNVITATSHLQYIAISINSPTTVTSNEDIASAYVSATTLSWDAVSFNNNLYIAYNTTTGGQAIKATYLTATAASVGGPPVTAVTFSGYKATLMSLCADKTASNPVIYLSFYDLSTTVGYTLGLDLTLSTVMIPIQTITSGTILNITSVAQGGICTLFYEVSNNYSYDAAIPSNYVSAITVRPSGVPILFHSVFSTAAGTITASSASGLSSGMHLVDNTTKANIVANTTFTISGTTLTLSNNTAGNSASSPGDVLSAQTVTVGSAYIVVRGVGLASKAFLNGGVAYFLSAFQSPYQPTYFLINGSTSVQAKPIVVAKLAYSNGGGYLTLGLPSVTLADGVAQIPYLFKDLIQAVNKNTNVSAGTQVNGIYSQTGINLVSFDLDSTDIDTTELGSDLHISGGFLWMYDGNYPVEHGFFLWPSSVEATGVITSGGLLATTYYYQATYEWSDNQGNIFRSAPSIPVSYTITSAPANFTGNRTSGSAVLASVSSFSGLQVGQAISGTGIPAATYILSLNPGGNSLTMSANATSGSATSTTVTPTTLSSLNISVPTYRLTYKTVSAAKIVIYRWSSTQQVYYQATSISTATLNDTTSDSITFTDSSSDATILGNNILYTTGGVIENIGAPATNIMTNFDTRVWLVDAEDPNLFWYSKQVIPSVPVEMSDLLTYYVAPNTGTESSTGPMRANAPMDDKLIIFKKDAIYYINGTGPDNTGADGQYSQPIFITSSVGSDNQQSIVLTPSGLMFQSDKGIWLLGRDLSTSYIGSGVEAYNSFRVTSAVNVPETTQVRFTLSNGITLMYDYYYNEWGTFDGVPAVSSCIYQGQHTSINSLGQAFQENPGSYLDGSNPVLMAFETGEYNLASLQGYQRFYDMYLLGSYVSPFKLNIGIAYNYSSSFSQNIVISPTNYTGPVGTDPRVGQTSPVGGPGNLFQWRLQPKQQLCQSFRLKAQEVYDPTFQMAAGEGLTLSSIIGQVGVKKGVRPIPAANQAG